MKATIIANGTVMPTISALRGLPRKRMRTMSTRPMPANTVCPTLSIVEIDQIGAIEIGHDLDVVGLQARIEFGDLGVHAVQHLRRIFVAQQQHGSFDDVVLVVLADDTVALLVAELELAEIAHQDRRAVVLGNDDIAEIVERLHQADAADHVAELAAIEHAAAGIGVVGADRIGDVVERNIEAHELLRIELELDTAS